MVFEYSKGAIKKMETSFLIGPSAVRQVAMVLN